MFLLSFSGLLLLQLLIVSESTRITDKRCSVINANPVQNFDTRVVEGPLFAFSDEDCFSQCMASSECVASSFLVDVGECHLHFMCGGLDGTANDYPGAVTEFKMVFGDGDITVISVDTDTRCQKSGSKQPVFETGIETSTDECARL